MTVHALLEPISGALPMYCLSDDYAGAEILWSVTVLGAVDGPHWGHLSLPEGLSVTALGASSSVTGILARHALDGWMDQLQTLGNLGLADTLKQTLAAHLAPPPLLQWDRWRLDLAQPRIMGIINVTPDSFSGDGIHQCVESAVAQGIRMAAEGADMLDVGGESSRPGAQPISSNEELDRVIPVLQALTRRVDLPVAIDTCKPEVMFAALEAGAAMVNDITALHACIPENQEQMDERSSDFQDYARRLAGQDVPTVLMHMQGTPSTMQEKPTYHHVCADVYGFLAERLRCCVANGLSRQRLIIDPGIGFGKSLSHNLDLLRHTRLFRGLGLPILLGVSRKRLVAAMSGEQDPSRRDVASHVLGVLAAMSGAHILRVHDVWGARQALSVAQAWSHGLEGMP